MKSPHLLIENAVSTQKLIIFCMWRFLNLISSITWYFISHTQIKVLEPMHCHCTQNFWKTIENYWIKVQMDKSALELFVGTTKIIGAGKVLISRITHSINYFCKWSLANLTKLHNIFENLSWIINFSHTSETVLNF